MYLYPDNLKAKATLFLWELRDVGIIGVGLLLSVFALAQLHIFLPIVITAVYAFLSIRFEGTSIKDSALRISPMAEASWTSATSMSLGAIPACS